MPRARQTIRSKEHGELRGSAAINATAADLLRAGRGFGDNKAFIIDVWKALQHPPDMTLKEFKGILAALHRAGDINLSRADLVEAMDPKRVAASETTDNGSVWHFVRVSR